MVEKLFNFKGMLRDAGKRMRDDLRQQLVSHPGELGLGREEIIRKFLRENLPERFLVSTGFVFDCHGTLSKQIDLIIADKHACANFTTSGGTRFFPCEAVVAVGQVKSRMDKMETLYDAMENLESVKYLDRSSGGMSKDSRYGESIDHTMNHLHQIFSFVFVTGKSLAADTVGSTYLEYVVGRPAHSWTNIIFSLDKFLVTFCCDHGICPNPMDARGVSVQKSSNKSDLLINFFVLLGYAIEATRVGGFHYWQYLRDATIFEGNVYHPLFDDAPPYLSSLY